MSKRGSKKEVPSESTHKARLSKKYQNSSSDDDEQYGDDGDADIKDWIVDDTGNGFEDDDFLGDPKVQKGAKNAPKATEKTILNLLNKQKGISAIKAGTFDSIDFNNGLGLDDILGNNTTTTTSNIDLDFDSFMNTNSSTMNDTDAAAIDFSFDHLMEQTTSGFESYGVGNKNKTKIRRDAGLDSLNNPTTTVLPADNYNYDAMDLGNDHLDQIDDVQLPDPHFEDASATTTTTTTAPGTKKQHITTSFAQDSLRQDDQKNGIAVLGKMNDEKIVYEHEITDDTTTTTTTEQSHELIDPTKLPDIIIKAEDLAKYSNHYIYVYSIYEDTAVRDGRLFLFGRLLLEDLDSHKDRKFTSPELKTKSICIIINEVERALYFLPRKHPVNKKGKADVNKVVDIQDVKSEVEAILQGYDIDHRMRVVSKQYCFGRRVSPHAFGKIKKLMKKNKSDDDNDNDDDYLLDDLGVGKDDNKMVDEDEKKDDDDEEEEIAIDTSKFYKDNSLLDKDNIIPREAHYVQVLYSTARGSLQQDLRGETFSHVFGTQTSRQESFIIDRKLKGPCWVAISSQHGKLSPKSTASWCDYELNLNGARYLNVVTDRDLPAPLFTSVSLSLKCAVRLTANNTYEKQIVMATLKYDHSNDIELSKTRSQQLRTFQNTWSIVAPPDGLRMPFDWEEKRVAFNTRHANLNAEINVVPNESKLLQILLHMLTRKQPDIIIGHDLHGSMVDILVQRFNAHKLGTQSSKFGLFRTSRMPRGRSGTSRSLVEDGVGAGRLLVDTQLMAREFHPSKQYSLDYLTEQLLGNKIKTVDQLVVHDYYANSSSLMELMAINILDAESQSRIMHNLDIIPLTKQLTNLCGNTWHSSLRSSRAERVEYLLLHTFMTQGYIPPEPPNTNRQTPFNTIDLDQYGYDMDPNSSNSNAKNVKNKNARKGSQKRATRGDDGDVDEMDFFDENTLVDSDDEDNKERQNKREEAAAAAAGSVGGDSGDGAANVEAVKKKAGYAGGKVLEPKRGFYNDWIAVLDFNSLYPSIIREYNLCFTTTQHWAIDIDVPNPNFDSFLPPGEATVGILPNVVRMLIDRRRTVRQAMPKATSDNERQMLNIKQLAFKLVANSLYGCLGFSSSRFYCRPIAACVTSKGRQALDNAVATAAANNANIIYGDTDSIMVNTQMQTYKDARAVAVRLKQGINKQYKVLNIDEDGYFKNMLLLRKKKYAAMKLEKVEPYNETHLSQLRAELASRPDGKKYHAIVMPNVSLEGRDISIDDPVLREHKESLNTFVFKREVKGLDMVRRDWSELCRKASSDVIDIVLRCDSGRRDEVVGAVTGLMSEINQLMTDNIIRIDDYVITKQLTRSLEQYQDVKKLPHVYVAWKASQRGKIIRAGDIVEFVMTTSESLGASSSQSDRACSKEDYINFIKHMANEAKLSQADPNRTITPYLDYPNDMKLDLIYYKESQLLTPIMRLIDVLEEMSSSMIAGCLGLDTAKYALRERRGVGGRNADDLASEASLIGTENAYDKFRDLPPLYISCPRCHNAFPFAGLFSYLPFSRKDVYLNAPQSQRERLTYWSLPFQMHTHGYTTKMNQCQFNKTGFICPTPDCPGLFDFGQMDENKDSQFQTPLNIATLTNYLCNTVNYTIREYIASFEQNLFLYNSKDLHNTIVTYAANGNVLSTDQYTSTELMSKSIEPEKVVQPQDVVTFIQYILHLFDYPSQRTLLQRECDSRLNRNIGTGRHSKAMLAATGSIKNDNKNDKLQSHNNSLDYYTKLGQQTRAEVQLFHTGQDMIDDELQLPPTLWTGSAGEQSLSNLDSEISPQILMVVATVHQHIKDTFLSHNGFYTIDLASLFASLRVE